MSRVSGEAQRVVTDLSAATLTDLPTSRNLAAALHVLLHARQCARDLGCDPWQFAVERATLRNEGVSLSDLRWLLWKEYLEHGVEITTARDAQRRFEPRSSGAFSKSSCFLLTEQGEAIATAMRGSLEPPQLPMGPAQSLIISGASFASRATPKWDCDLREVRFKNQVVKQFKVPSSNQEMILTAFEEENWPRRIDDPLPPDPEKDPKQRLHDTIRSLNRNQRNTLLRFMGDGTGEGVIWEAIESGDDSRRSTEEV